MGSWGYFYNNIRARRFSTGVNALFNVISDYGEKMLPDCLEQVMTERACSSHLSCYGPLASDIALAGRETELKLLPPNS